jgi:carbamoyltransferase
MTFRLYQLLEENETIIDANYADVIDLIQQKHLVALFQGRSEAGPRALGNRTLMFDPTVPNGKDLVNLIKRREWFRPFAASCMLEHVHEWFDMAGLKESPFMMYAVDALPGVAEKVPSVIHVDNTCRVQTVTQEQNKHWYNLIKEFNSRTGVPMLFNTSFNLAGDPLVETIDDALDTLRRSDIEYLYLPDIGKLVKVPN